MTAKMLVALRRSLLYAKPTYLTSHLWPETEATGVPFEVESRVSEVVTRPIIRYKVTCNQSLSGSRS